MKEFKRLGILSITFVLNLSSKSIIPACPLTGFYHRPQFVFSSFLRSAKSLTLSQPSFN